MSGSGHKYRVGVLVISDRAAAGERSDQCREVVETALVGTSYSAVSHLISSDDAEQIGRAMAGLLAKDLDLLLTSGGTGCGPRDNTPEVTRQFIKRPTPGIDEAIRRFSTDKSPNALYSRAVSGIGGNTLIINLPGSPTAVKEILQFLLPTISHPLDLLRGRLTDCAGKEDER